MGRRHVVQDQHTGKMMVTLPHGELQQLEFDIAALRAAAARLRAALEKHHWPDLVPGDGPCDVCGLDASVAYQT